VHAEAIQDAFAAADSEERHLCAAISNWSKVLAEDGRFLSRASSTAEVVAATAATSTDVSALLLRRSEMIVRPTDQCFALVLKQPEDDTHLTVLPWRQSDMRLLNAAAHPWSTELLQDFRIGVGLFEGRGSQRKNDSIKCLVGLTSPHSTSEVPNFPPKSTEVTCGALCLKSSHSARIRQFMQIKTLLSMCASRCAPKNKPALISSVDCILAVEGAGRHAAFYRLSDAKVEQLYLDS
jgi:hypothetical protein